MTIIVNGIEKTLEYWQGSCETAHGLLRYFGNKEVGNTDTLKQDNQGRYIMSQDQYDYWAREIAQMVEIDELQADLNIPNDAKLTKAYLDATEHTKSRDMDIISNIKLKWLKNKMKGGKTA